MKGLELVINSDFKSYIFYGEDKLPTTQILRKRKDGSCDIYDFSKINWNTVPKMNNGYYNYSYAIGQLLNKPNCKYIAFVIDKILKLKVIYICHEEDKLYMEVK